MESGTPPVQSEVNKCYMFKSRLQEYAQRAQLNTPEYHTVKEGAAHDPEFRSTVIVNGVNYDSLPRFATRKEAEQSAAEVALLEILKSGQKIECIPSVHGTGLCKNLLQEYAQKMNYAIPLYTCTKQGVGPAAPCVCTVEIGGIQYIGASARTKKEAEIKAARTALLAIQSMESVRNGASQYTVLPIRKKAEEKDVNLNKNKKLKIKKNNFKKRNRWNEKKKLLRKKNGEDVETGEYVPAVPQTGENGVTEEVVFGEQRTGEVVLGEQRTGEVVIGEQRTGEVVLGEQRTGEVVLGEQRTGEVVLGEQRTGELVLGEQRTGEEVMVKCEKEEFREMVCEGESISVNFNSISDLGFSGVDMS